MCHLVVLVFSSFSGKETGLAHVKVEALQAAVTKALKKNKTDLDQFSRTVQGSHI
jgi:hypothetical protein